MLIIRLLLLIPELFPKRKADMDSIISPRIIIKIIIISWTRVKCPEKNHIREIKPARMLPGRPKIFVKIKQI